jgi:hypothetical protein
MSRERASMKLLSLAHNVTIADCGTPDGVEEIDQLKLVSPDDVLDLIFGNNLLDSGDQFAHTLFPA